MQNKGQKKDILLHLLPLLLILVGLSLSVSFLFSVNIGLYGIRKRRKRRRRRRRITVKRFDDAKRRQRRSRESCKVCRAQQELQQHGGERTSPVRPIHINWQPKIKLVSPCQRFDVVAYIYA